MKGFLSFLRLIRWPNLFFIVLTQILFRAIIFPYVYRYNDSGIYSIKLTYPIFWWLVGSSVCIAAAGYIINDYFDVNIDQVNKSLRVIVGKHINRRLAILLHALFSLMGLLGSMYVGYLLRNPYIPIFNLLAILLLVFYSTTFKKKLLVGNVIISLLTAWVVWVLTLAEFRPSLIYDPAWHRLLKLSFLYGGFAFVTSLIREAIKDMEDMSGDAKYDCTTMPIVWGLPASKVYAGVWISVLCGLTAAIIIYISFYGWWLGAGYSILLVLVPLLLILRKLYKSNTAAQFHQLSNRLKWVMLTGILSMIFFNFG